MVFNQDASQKVLDSVLVIILVTLNLVFILKWGYLMLQVLAEKYEIAKLTVE